MFKFKLSLNNKFIWISLVSIFMIFSIFGNTVQILLNSVNFENSVDDAASATNPYRNMLSIEVLKSKSSFEKLIQEHTQKLSDYIANPFKFDNKGILKNATPEIRQKIIQGRIQSLEKQLIKQQGELQKILEVLGG